MASLAPGYPKYFLFPSRVYLIPCYQTTEWIQAEDVDVPVLGSNSTGIRGALSWRERRGSGSLPRWQQLPCHYLASRGVKDKDLAVSARAMQRDRASSDETE